MAELLSAIHNELTTPLVLDANYDIVEINATARNKVVSLSHVATSQGCPS